MKIDKLEYFLVLADVLNFTKASELLHITQPHLSKAIMSLEDELGVRLLTRNKRDVALTPAGEVFYREMKITNKLYFDAINKTIEADSGIQGVIKIGFLGTAVIRDLPKIVKNFRSRYPKILLDLIDYTFSPLHEALIDKTIDVALIPDQELDRFHWIVRKHLFEDDMCLVVSRDHPVSEFERVYLWDVREEPVIMLDADISPRDYNMVGRMCLEQGFFPRKILYANTLNNLMIMVSCNMGVSILAHHMERFATDDLRFVKIAGYENFFKVACAWDKNNNPNVLKFIEVAENYMNARRDATPSQ
jgi:DNA-binding transcriptional LysR family regulator